MRDLTVERLELLYAFKIPAPPWLNSSCSLFRCTGDPIRMRLDPIGRE